MTKEEWSVLNAKLYRGFKVGGKQVPKLSSKEAEWIYRYLDCVSSEYQATEIEFRGSS